MSSGRSMAAPAKSAASSRLGKEIKKHSFFYLLMLPGILFFVVFKYIPMAGIIVAFKDVAPFDSLQAIVEKPFVGFKHFEAFFSSNFFWNTLRNTVMLSLMNLFIGFPLPIIFALMLNEINSKYFKKTVQTVSYLPHFLSTVIVSGLVVTLLSPNGGLVNSIIGLFGESPIFFLGSNDHIRWVITYTGIWQELGWGAIIYLAALTGISPDLYEAATVDGAGKWRQLWTVTLPGILPIICIMFILQVGKILDAGFERVFLLYSPAVYEKADIIDTFVFRKGLNELQYSFSTAVGLFKSIIALVMIVFTNWAVKKSGQESLW